jgi:hypothetical protein
MFQTTFIENIKTHILRPMTFFFENRAIYDIMWKNMVQPNGPQMTIACMLCACWIAKAIDTRSEYVILVAFPRQQWLRERASMLRYTYMPALFEHTACFVIWFSLRQHVLKNVTSLISGAHYKVLVPGHFKFTLDEENRPCFRKTCVEKTSENGQQLEQQSCIF